MIDRLRIWNLNIVQRTDQFLGLTDRQPIIDDPHGQLLEQLAITQPGKGPGVAGGEQTVHDHLLDAIWEVEQPEAVGDSRSTPAHPDSHLMLGEAELIHQPMEGGGLLQGVQVIAMEVLDDRLFQGVAVLGLPHHRGHHGQTCSSGSPPTPFTGHELITPASLPEQEGLEYPHLLDGSSQLSHALVVEHPTGLVAVRLDVGHRHHLEPDVRGRRFGRRRHIVRSRPAIGVVCSRRYKGRQALTKSALLHLSTSFASCL